LGRCTNCGLHYLSQLLTRKTHATRIKEAYCTKKRYYIDACVHRKSEVCRLEDFQHFYNLLKQLAPPGKWLDIGCGTGTFIETVQKLGIEIEGVELIPGRKQLAVEITKTKIHDRPIELLDLPADSFSVVTMINVFSHLTSPAATLSYIHRILQQSGVLLLYTSEIGAGVNKHHNHSWNLGDHRFYLGEHTIERYAERIGFEVFYREKRWAPGLLYSRENLLVKGRSTLRNIIKKSCVYTPGVLQVMRWYMLKIRNKNNPNYVSTLLLRRITGK